LKLFLDENWVYYCKDSTLYKTCVDAYGFFNTDHGVAVDFCAEAQDHGRISHLERLKSLLMPKPELSDGMAQLTLF
jgi:hypothetical protein